MTSGDFISVLSVLLIFSCFSAYRCGLNANGEHVITVRVAYTTKVNTWCGFWSLWRCSKVVTRYRTKYMCETGWRANGGTDCSYAICEGEINPQACNQNRQVSTKYGMQFKESRGYCLYPGECINCNIYFYNAGSRCNVCPSIPNCVEMHCYDTAASTICACCEGVVRDAPYYRAYVTSDDRKQCLQACSWRTDSTRCFPGHCREELASNCKCLEGFSGRHCEIMTDQANIVSNWFNLRHQHEVLNNPVGTVDVGSHPTVWSNYGGWNIAETVWNAQYVIKSRLDISPSHYIKNFVYGIIEASTILNFTHSFNQSAIHARAPNKTDIVKKYRCPEASRLRPATSSFQCMNNFSLESESGPFNFSTGDIMTFKIEAHIGGHVIIENRERNINETHQLVGTARTQQYTFSWDFVLPYHCIERETNLKNCSVPLFVPDLTEKSNITVTWGDWFDDLSGLREYKYQIHTVSYRNSILQEDGLLNNEGEGTVHLNETFVCVILLKIIKKRWKQ